MPQVMLLYRWQYTKTNSKLGLTQFFFFKCAGDQND